MGESTEFYTPYEIERIFLNALSPADYEKVKALDPPLSTAIEERTVTALFTDLRGATLIESALGKEGARKVITRMLSAITDAATANGGYIDKYMGDASMILFGAPLPMEPEAQAKAACRTALTACSCLRDLGYSVGVGFNTGEVSIGCLSPRPRPTYTPMGSDINLASRLEGESKAAGNHPCVLDRTRDLIEPDFRTVPMGSILVRSGRGEERLPRALFAVIGERTELSTEETAFWERHDEAAALLDKGKHEEALASLERLAAERPDEGLIRSALERTRRSYAAGLGERFASAKGIEELAAELEAACSRIFGQVDLGLLEQSLDGLWRFRPEPPFASRELLLSPEGEALAWLRGLPGPAQLDMRHGSEDSATGATILTAPEPLGQVSFAMAAPLRLRNELVAVLFLGPGAERDPVALGALAESFVEPWIEARAAETKERFREKVDLATKLEEVNRELESKSAALGRALAEIRDLNQGLEARVAEAAGRLERAASLKRYLPASVVEDIIEGRRDLAPRTERRKITVLFSDLRGFTEATDGLEPEELANLIDEYLSAMSDIAFAAGATIDKFRGDGMMLFFGAPEPVEPGEGARRCLRMAAAMCGEVERLRAKWFEAGYDWDLGVRMGINTGYATVGEFGSKDRMDYTAIGSEVNLASRLEGCCETNSIVVSHSTWALVREEFRCEPLGELEIRGIHRPVRAYRVDWRAEA